MNKDKRQMEYSDSPSGFVTLYNYKEPFMKFEEGYGYLGTLLFDGKTDTIQCHFCGDWFSYLPHHLHKEHSMTAKQYKEKIGLLSSSALISESEREKLMHRLVSNLPNKKDKKISKKTRKKISEAIKLSNNSM